MRITSEVVGTEIATFPLANPVQYGFFLARAVFRLEIGAIGGQLADPVFGDRTTRKFPGRNFGHVGRKVCADVGACGGNTVKEPPVGCVDGPGAD